MKWLPVSESHNYLHTPTPTQMETKVRFGKSCGLPTSKMRSFLLNATRHGRRWKSRWSKSASLLDQLPVPASKGTHGKGWAPPIDPARKSIESNSLATIVNCNYISSIRPIGAHFHSLMSNDLAISQPRNTGKAWQKVTIVPFARLREIGASRKSVPKRRAQQTTQLVIPFGVHPSRGTLLLWCRIRDSKTK